MTRVSPESAQLRKDFSRELLEHRLVLLAVGSPANELRMFQEEKEDSNMSILAFILFLIVAAACAYLGELLVPGTIPGGFITSAIVGIIGAWVGSSVMGSFGPSLAGVALIPCILGSAIVVFLLALVSRGLPRRV